MKTKQVGQKTETQHFGQRELIRHARNSADAVAILNRVTEHGSPYPLKYQARCKKVYKEVWERTPLKHQAVLKVEPSKPVVQETKDVFLPHHEEPERRSFKKGKPHLNPGRHHIGSIGALVGAAALAAAVAR